MSTLVERLRDWQANVDFLAVDDLISEAAVTITRLEGERDEARAGLAAVHEEYAFARKRLLELADEMLAAEAEVERLKSDVADLVRAGSDEATENARLRAELAGPLPPHAGDLWWDANDGESGYTDPFEAYEAVTDWNGNDYPVELSRARSLPHVWAVRVTLTRDDAGDPDETEVQLFNTEAEAQAALTPAQET